MIFPKIISNRDEKIKIVLNESVYSGLSVLDLSKIQVYTFWYNYIKERYGDKAQLCCTDIDSFIIHMKTEDFSNDVKDDEQKLTHQIMKLADLYQKKKVKSKWLNER